MVLSDKPVVDHRAWARGQARGPGVRGQRGMVTVELAVGFLAAAAVTIALSAAVIAGLAQAGVSSTSAELARYLGRGDQVAADALVSDLPPGSTHDVESVQGGVQVQVRMPIELAGGLELTLEGQSWARLEPGVG